MEGQEIVADEVLVDDYYEAVDVVVAAVVVDYVVEKPWER